MVNSFRIDANVFLDTPTQGYYNCDYKGWRTPGNPDFLCILKNRYNNEDPFDLYEAEKETYNRIVRDVGEIIKIEQLAPCVIVSVPRAKALDTYTDRQLCFIKAVSDAAKALPGAEDGTKVIQRHTNTKTTHLGREQERVTKSGRREVNDGKTPYRGITKKTCSIDREAIAGRNIILIDDIYTKTINIDEDCLQALYEAGAKKVVFYSIGNTKRDR